MIEALNVQTQTASLMIELDFLNYGIKSRPYSSIILFSPLRVAQQLVFQIGKNCNPSLLIESLALPKSKVK